MDMFTDRSPGRGPDPEAEILLISAAMKQAAESAPSLPDLVPVALAQGRRRRHRARAAVGAGVTGVVALGVFGAVLPLWSSSEGTHPAQTWSAASQATTFSPQPSPEATARPAPAPVHIEPSAGETGMAGLPEAERTRQEQFQSQTAVLLDELLHEQLGTVRPVDLEVSRYQGESRGNTFPVVFSVRPKADPGGVPTALPCRDIPSKGFRCRTARLPGGIRVRAITAEGNGTGSQTITGVDLTFAYGDSTVRLSVSGDDSSMVSAPVTVDQLVATAGDSRFLKLVQYADGHPMEDKEHSVRGG